MKFKNTTIRLFALSISVILLSISSCNKGPEPATVEITTLPAMVEGGNKAVFSATIDGVTSSVNGFLYGTEAEPTLENAIHIPAGSPIDGGIMSTVSVEPSIPTYYLRAYAYVNDEMHYGNEVSFTTGHAIGESFEGGRVAYILQDGDPGYDANTEHGLIIANEYFGTDIVWGCDSIDVSSATGMEIGTGAANTAGILATCALEGSAAYLCDNYESDGYTDWYLPSFRELEAIDTNFDILEDIEGGHYWSSTQSADTLKAWAIYMWTNEGEAAFPSGEYKKDLERRAIAVRSF